MKITEEKILNMDYVDFLALLNETNRPPGGKNSIRIMAINSFIDSSSHVLHSGCNTGYCTFEIAHLTKCRVIAFDINKNMILAAQKKLDPEPNFYKKIIKFQLGDARNLKFKDNTFDLVFSGGSTAFMSNPVQAVREHKRVCKPYGFLGDICLFYKRKPPLGLLNKINYLLDIKIKPWDKNYWLSLYKNEGLELYFDYTSDTSYNQTKKEVREYSEKMIEFSLEKYSNSIKNIAVEKLFAYMSLFNENHKYLGYCILLFRKNIAGEQISLFGE